MKTPNMRKSEVDLLRQIVSRREKGGAAMDPQNIPNALLAILASVEDPPPGKPPISAEVRETYLRRVNIMENLALDIIAICGELKRRLRSDRREA
jgi:hypothetical protein